MLDFDRRRQLMVAEQIEARGIVNARVVAAMRQVPRHEFVSPELGEAAYDDRPLPIGEGQTISQPYMVAIMTDALDPQPFERVLEIGTGSGYQAALLSCLAREVISIERRPALAARARAALARLGYANVAVEVGDGTEGWPAAQPYDGIIVTAGAPRVPDVLRAQLADGGRLVIPVGSAWYQELVVATRRGDAFDERRREGCVFVPLVGRFGWDDERPRAADAQTGARERPR